MWTPLADADFPPEFTEATKVVACDDGVHVMVYCAHAKLWELYGADRKQVLADTPKGSGAWADDIIAKLRNPHYSLLLKEGNLVPIGEDEHKTLRVLVSADTEATVPVHFQHLIYLRNFWVSLKGLEAPEDIEIYKVLKVVPT